MYFILSGGKKMASLSKKHRVLNTFEYAELDRYAIYDKIHNIDLIEHAAGEKITEKNAQDVTCRALGKLCDMVRHVAIPYTLDEHIEKDEDGFVYRVKWYTKDLIYRPFKTEAEAVDIVKNDIEKISPPVPDTAVPAKATGVSELSNASILNSW